jgi:methionyl-tRNA synthetase
MSARPRFFLTTAIDYPNSRPHIGTAFEKLGADVQARFQRMQGKDVFFLMGNDENTIKVAKRAAELGRDVKEYCDDMACQFREVWNALDVSYDDFIQTSEERHHVGCRRFIQTVHDNGYIDKGTYEGWYCEGCEAFKTEKELIDGQCPDHKVPAVRRTEPCYYFRLSAFQDRLLKFYEENPEFIQPESRRNEIVALVTEELKDVNITRTGQKWGIRVPFGEEFTIYVWFDALLNYITAIGYGTDDARFRSWWPADVHVIGKDITRFHCALWPAMLWAAGLEPPRKVFGHGFVQVKNEATGVVEKIGKSLGNAIEPMEIISRFSGEAFRYYFLRECPFPGDGEFSWTRFAEVYNAELANNYGNLFSRVITLASNPKTLNGVLAGTAGRTPRPIDASIDVAAVVAEVQGHVEAFRYSQALQTIVAKVLTPTNKYVEDQKPWALVKTDAEAAKQVLFDLAGPLRTASILLKPFLPRGTETVYQSFNFATPWEQVSYADAARPLAQPEDLRVMAALEGGKVKPLYPRIG